MFHAKSTRPRVLKAPSSTALLLHGAKAGGQSALVTALSLEKWMAGCKGGIAAWQEIEIKTKWKAASPEVFPS